MEELIKQIMEDCETESPELFEASLGAIKLRCKQLQAECQKIEHLVARGDMWRQEINQLANHQIFFDSIDAYEAAYEMANRLNSIKKITQ
jgi:hypothetical protein